MKTDQTLLASSIALSTLVAGNAAAQSVLEEIIVTAQKREQTLMEVPLSILVLSGDFMKEQSLLDLEQVAQFIPNISVSQGEGRVTVRARGLGTTGFNPGFEQSVAIFNDGIYSGRQIMTVASLFDQGQIEALLGPQPEYYGQSAIAGLIGYNSVRPTEELDGYAIVEAGENGNRRYEGAVGGGIADGWAARVSGSYSETGGWITRFVDGGDANAGEDWGVRVALSGEIGDSISLWAKTEHWEQVSNGSPQVAVVCDPLGQPLSRNTSCRQALDSGLAGSIGEGTYTSNIGAAAVRRGGTRLNYTRYGPFQAENLGIDADGSNNALELQWQINEDLLFTSLTGYAEYESLSAQDLDRTPFSEFGNVAGESYEQWSQEVRLQSTSDTALQWMVGGYLHDQEIDQGFNIYTSQTLRRGPRVIVAGGLSPNEYQEEAAYWNTFGSIGWEFVENWALDVGVRYTDVDKDGRSERLSADVLDADGRVVTGTAGVVASATAATVGADHSCLGYSRFGVPCTTTDPLTGNEITRPLEYDKDQWTYSAALRWDVTDRHNLWARHARGWKAGGFSQGETAHTVETFGIYDGEIAKTYELGGHFSFVDGRVGLNATYFYTEYTDLQVEQSVINPRTGDFSRINANAAEALSKGVELNGFWQVTDRFSINGALAVLDAQYEEYIDQCSALELQDTVDAAGGRIVVGSTGPADCTITSSTMLRTTGEISRAGASLGSPDWTGSLSANYASPISSTLEVSVSLAASLYGGQDDNRAVPEEQRSRDAFAVLNFNAGVGSADGTWLVSVYGRNMTDEWYWTIAPSSQSTSGNSFASVAQDANWGVQLRYNLGN